MTRSKPSHAVGEREQRVARLASRTRTAFPLLTLGEDHVASPKSKIQNWLTNDVKSHSQQAWDWLK